MDAHPTQVKIGLPVIDIAPLFDHGSAQARAHVGREIQSACRACGFFYITGHGISETLIGNLESASQRFFALPMDVKMRIAMAKGGAAWRGFFPVGGELTSGRPDIKEGLYLGTELPAGDPRVKAGWPLHGGNLWPAEVPELRGAALDYMAATTRAGHALIEGIAIALGLNPGYFAEHYTAEPTILFRLFHYPDTAQEKDDRNTKWGVGEHTDYGLLTLLAQDRSGGLQVKTAEGWIDAPPLPETLVCNIGDMLDRLTGGWFRSNPHRVRNESGRGRLSFPLFFDPNFAAEMRRLPENASFEPAPDDGPGAARWDNADLQAFEGTYGDYLLAKVSKVFPELGHRVL